MREVPVVFGFPGFVHPQINQRNEDIEAVHEVKARGSSEDKALKLLARGRGVYLIAASTQFKNAYEIEQLGHGVLTYVILDGLGEKGSPKAPEVDDMVTVEALIPYVQQQVPELTEKYMKGQRQQPITTSTGTDFPLVVP